ncbi:MAG: hypothetical protein IPP93_11685 [Chitinophagaceae bacterium]|nr:hypothetical protein [Chitinophagaceae bacterium]
MNNNAIVTAFAKTGAGGTIIFVTDNGSTVTGAVSNCQNNNFSNVTLTGATAITGINYTDGGTAPTRTVSGNTLSNWTTGAATVNAMNFTYWNGVSSLNNNTITNINGQGAITAITIGSSVNTATSVGITANTINNLISTGTGGAVTGITSSNTSTAINISGNLINTLSSTGAAAVSGIVVSGATANNVFKNKICDLSGSNASSTVNGILASAGSTNTIYNNLIGDLRAPAANAANPVVGLNLTGGTTASAYYNTVYLNASSSGALFGSSAVSASTTPTVTLRNNIFYNNSSVTGAGLAAAYRRSTTTLTSYGAASNNNLFAGSTIFTDGTNTDATIAAYKARVASRDASSINEDLVTGPTFLSTTCGNSNFLHISTSIATQLESGAASVAGITDDFDGDVRNGSTPDIGADEFAGIAADFTPPSINYTPLTFTCGTGNRTLTASITDASGVPTSGAGLPVLYWKINAGAYTAVTGTFVSGNNYQFSFGAGVSAGDVVSYYIVAQDNAGTPNVGSFPSAGASGFTANPPAAATPTTSPSTYSINIALSGTKTVGASGADYATLNAAFNAYNTSCLAGPVVFSLLDAAYTNVSDTLRPNADASAVNTLTIKPTQPVTAINGNTTAAPIVLYGADYIIIDGSTSATVNSICPSVRASVT